MATKPIPEATYDELPLTREQGWDLLESLYGSLEGAFPEEGGASGILRREREAWGE